MAVVETERAGVQVEELAELWVGERYVAMSELRAAHEALMLRYVGVLGEAERLAPKTPRRWLSTTWKLWPFRLQAAITRLFVWGHLKRMSGALITIYGQLHVALPSDGEAVGWLRGATQDLAAFRGSIPGFFVRGASPALVIPVLTFMWRWMALGVFVVYILLGFGCIPAYLVLQKAFTLKRGMFLRPHGESVPIDGVEHRADTVRWGCMGLRTIYSRFSIDLSVVSAAGSCYCRSFSPCYSPGAIWPLRPSRFTTRKLTPFHSAAG